MGCHVAKACSSERYLVASAYAEQLVTGRCGGSGGITTAPEWGVIEGFPP